MKLKKILAAFIASAAVISSVAVTGFALNDGEATYCFDNGNKISDWQTYGSLDETGFKITQTNAQSKNGNGSLLISEKVTGDTTNAFGGAYVTASSVGIDNFGGCTISMSLLLCEGAEKFCENLTIYSEGMIWIQTPPSNLSSTTWTEVTLQIPADADNSKVGFTIPTLQPHSGDIVYIDDFTITRADGTIVSNLGDYQPKAITEINTVSKGTNIALIILLVVLILAIVGGIGFIISSSTKRYH